MTSILAPSTPVVATPTLTLDDLLQEHGQLSALPMYQAWAGCVFHAGKDIDNRDRPLHKRGTILIYSTVMRKGTDEAFEIINDRKLPIPDGMPLLAGALLGAVDLVDCTDNTSSDEWVGTWGMPRSWHWHFANPRPLTRREPYRPNSQGWFFVTAESVAAQRQLRL